MAVKTNTTNWSTTREVDVALPFYNNVREMVIMQRHTWDNLLYRDTKTFEYKPLLATSYKWVNDKTLVQNPQGVKFHNGASFSADDVVNLQPRVCKGFRCAHKAQRKLDRPGEKVDADTVRVYLKTFPAALEYVSGPMAIFPKDIWGTAKKNAKENRLWNRSANWNWSI